MDYNCWYFELDSTFERVLCLWSRVSVAIFTGIKMTAIIIKITEVKMLHYWGLGAWRVHCKSCAPLWSLHTAQACTNTRAGSWNHTAAPGCGCGARPTLPLPPHPQGRSVQEGAQGKSLAIPAQICWASKHRISHSNIMWANKKHP